MESNLKSNKMYFGYNFDNIKNQIKNNLSSPNLKMKDFGGVIKIEFQECTIFVDSIFNISIITSTDKTNSISIDKNINSIQNIIKREIEGFKFIKN